jgi:hypothetical protein
MGASSVPLIRKWLKAVLEAALPLVPRGRLHSVTQHSIQLLKRDARCVAVPERRPLEAHLERRVAGRECPPSTLRVVPTGGTLRALYLPR